MLEIKKRDLLINVFDDISDLYNFIQNTPRRPRADDSSVTNDDWFSGGVTYNEAVEIMRYGDDKLFKKILDKKKKADITKIIGQSQKRRKQNNDMVGFTANVPAYLSGNPMAMINRNDLRETHKILDIYLNGGVSAGISSDKVQEVGTVYLNVIDILEKLGYRCNLYIGDSSIHNDEKMFMLVKIKTDREPLNIKKMAFPIAHVGMFRRIGFRWIESCNCDTEPTHHGYGQPLRDWLKAKKILDKELKKDFITLDYQSSSDVSIKEAVKCLEKQGLKLDIEL